MRRLAAFLLLCAAASGPAAAQERAPADSTDDRVARDLVAYRDSINIFKPQPFRLRPFVLPGSERVIVDGAALDTSAYRLDYRRGRLWLKIRPPEVDSRLVVRYRTFPFRFRDVYRRRGAQDTTSGGAVAIREEEREDEGPGFDPFEGVTLERSGTISRGVIAGSNRDATVESGLRMQLSGNVSEDVHVRAVLTDENTPLQPEGTTQRLDDFDRVFVELAAPQGTARLGDVDLALGGTEFARFSRKLQGATVTAGVPEPQARWLSGGNVTVAGATARGTYRSQRIEPLDGVQGPYQLQGEDGEEFIIVVAGSETVYLDGERLTRGASADYTIDYALGEVTFTARRLITEDRRIRVEFEYRTNEFTRTLVAGQGTAGLWERAGDGPGGGEPRLEVGATFIREADSRTLGGALDLSSSDSLRLANAGDARAIGSGAEQVPFDAEAPFVQYRREVRDAPGGGTADTVFVALDEAPPEGAPVFRVRFTDVGAGQGRYARGDRGINGVVYEFRGDGQGRYAPIRRLPRPRQQRLFDVHGRFAPVDGVELFGEWARSLNDRNRFSSLDAGDDQDRAYRAGLRLQPTTLEVGKLTLGTLSGEVGRHVRGQNFTSFVRTRPVEFGRKWNLPEERVSATGGVRGAGDETVDEGRVRLGFAEASSVEAALGRLTLGDAFTGWRRAGGLQLEEAGWPRLDYRIEYLTSRDRLGTLGSAGAGGGIDGRWLRQRGALRQPLLGGRLTPRFEIEQEDRRQRAAGTDSLAPRSFSFVEVRPGLAYGGDVLQGGVEVEFRTESEAAEGNLRDASSAWTVQTNVQYQPSDALDLEGRLGYRRRRVRDFFRLEKGREDTDAVLVEAQGRWRPFGGEALEVRGLYNAQTERTPVLQELYVRVGPARGQYIWEDANDDGLVQTDELLPEPTPNEGTYVRRFVPSDSLTPVASVRARLRLNAAPGRRWNDASLRWKRLLARAETQTTIEVQEQSRTPDLADVYLLNLSQFRQPGRTQDGRLRLGQQVRLFPGTARYGLDLSVDQVRSLSDLTAGTERRFLSTWEAEGRYKPAQRWSVSLTGFFEQSRTRSEAFSSRRYDIDSYRIEPEVTFRPLASLRLTGGGAFAQKSDAVGTRRARIWRVPLQAEFSRARRFRLTARGEVARVDLTGDAEGLARFELTDGRGPGTSLRWGLNGRYAISRNLQASLSYDGRAPAAAPTVNTVRLNLSASF